MQYIIEKLFPTPIYVSIIDNLEEVQTELDNALPNIQFEDIGFSDWGKTHKISSSQFKDDLIKTYNLEVFKQTVDKHIKSYCNELKFSYNSYDLTSWMTSFDTGEYGHIHTHPRSDMSGVYYYKTNGEDGNIFFMSGNESCKNSICFGSYGDRWIHSPVIGKIILFPSYLSHGITTNTSDSIRHSISFNISFK